MSVSRLAAALIVSLSPAPTLAQGFAGMATDATGYALPAVHPVFSFPADHGAHPEFRIEWWYVTANLCGPDGTPYGAQWTLFRTALRPPGEASADIGWSSPQIWFAHAALTSAGLHVTAQEYARGGIGQAGVTPAPFAAWINDWTMAAPDAPAGQDALDRLQLTARGTDFAYDLSLVTEAPLVLHGAGGYSLKSPRGQASLYYSQPGYRVEGRIVLPSGPVDVTGLAWLDREWSSQPLGDGQHGWDWFALHFDGGAALMVYRLRDDSGPDFTPATWIDADGSSRPLPEGAVRLTPLTETPVAGHRLPTEWRLEWPDGGLDVIARALNPRAWMATDISYWEGPVQVTGSHTGVGYLEMTGYR